MKFNNPVLLSAVANSGTKLSTAVDARFITMGSFQATFSDGAAAGTVVLQGSNDPEELLPANAAPVHWNDIANTSTAVTSGASKLVAVANLNYRWIRASWTSSGGAGTVTVTAFFQGF